MTVAKYYGPLVKSRLKVHRATEDVMPNVSYVWADFIPSMCQDNDVLDTTKLV
jgi:hypothetical protein